jgi:hypothetical protein
MIADATTDVNANMPERMHTVSCSCSPAFGHTGGNSDERAACVDRLGSDCAADRDVRWLLASQRISLNSNFTTGSIVSRLGSSGCLLLGISTVRANDRFWPIAPVQAKFLERTLAKKWHHSLTSAKADYAQFSIM